MMNVIRELESSVIEAHQPTIPQGQKASTEILESELTHQSRASSSCFSPQYGDVKLTIVAESRENLEQKRS